MLKLIKGEWWLAPTKMTTDDDGQISFTGFLGEYEVSLDQRRVLFAVNDKGETHIAVDI